MTGRQVRRTRVSTARRGGHCKQQLATTVALQFLFLFQRYTHRPFAGSLVDNLKYPGLGQAKARNSEPNLHFPCGRQGPKDLDHLLPPRVRISKVRLEVKLRFEPRHSALNADAPGSVSTVVPSTSRLCVFERQRSARPGSQSLGTAGGWAKSAWTRAAPSLPPPAAGAPWLGVGRKPFQAQLQETEQGLPHLAKLGKALLTDMVATNPGGPRSWVRVLVLTSRTDSAGHR